jgi:dATP pyrophosphohydrolase
MRVRHDMVYCFAARPSAKGGSHEFLQLRRCKDDFMGGTWQPVCGRIEPDEKAWEAAVRELREETGLAPREFYVIEFVNSFYIPSQDTMWHCANFLAVVDRDATITLNDEHDAHRWVPAKQVEKSFMWPGDRRAIEEATRQILEGDSAGKDFLKIPL